MKKQQSGKAATVLFVLMLLVLAAVNLLDFPLSVPYMIKTTGQKYLDMQGFYTAKEAYALLDTFGEKGRSLQFRLLFTIDILIPLLSGFASFAMISFLFRRSELINLRYVAVLASLLDFAENTGIGIMLVNWPERMEFTANMTGLATAVKSGLYTLSVMIIVTGIIYRGMFYAKREI